MGAVFISYRRDDTEGQAGRLYDDLVEHFGKGAVFMDVVGLEAGRDFRKAIDQHVSSCGVLLALIGTNWLSATNAEGKRRLDDQNDFVRLEVAAALKRDIPVVPVLVRGARMPRAEELPPDCQDLSYRNGVELTHARWDSDIQLLISALRPHVHASGEPKASPGPTTATPAPASRVLARSTLAALALVVGLIGIGLTMWVARSPRPAQPEQSTEAVQSRTPTSVPRETASRPLPEPSPSTSIGTTGSEPPPRERATQPSTATPPGTFAPRIYVCNLNPLGDNFLSLRAEPDGRSREVVRLGENTILMRLEDQPPWLHVKTRDGAEGWVHSRWICEGSPPRRPRTKD